MKYGKNKITYVFILMCSIGILLCQCLNVIPAEARETLSLPQDESSQQAVQLDASREQSAYLPPHLIQSVTEQDVYEGMASLGMLECPILEEPDIGQAYENVWTCVVRLNMGNAYGSGLIWDLTPEAVIIVTNAHVLEYWQDSISFVHFPQGYYTDAEIMGISEQYDVGFLRVENGNFSYEELESLRHVCADEAVYDSLRQGDSMFCVGAGPAVGAVECYEGTVQETWRYIAEFESDMLYCYGFAKAGMSGGGVFDGCGHLIGMLSGGTSQNETASVPLPSLIAVYDEVTGS